MTEKGLTISEENLKRIKKFRLSRATTTNVLVMSVGRDMDLIIEKEMIDTDFEELVNQFDNLPLYFLMTFEMTHHDNRKSVPFCLIFYSPSGGPPESLFLHSRSLSQVIKMADVGKVVTLSDPEDFTKEWLTKQI